MTKKIRLSFVRSVSGDLHVLHVTYSTGKFQAKNALALLSLVNGANRQTHQCNVSTHSQSASVGNDL